MKRSTLPEPKRLMEVPRDGEKVLIDPTKIEVANPRKKGAINIWNIIRNLAFLGAFILILYGFYVTFASRTVLNVTNEPAPIVGENLKPGQPIVIHLEFCKYVDVIADVIPMMIGQNVPNLYLPAYVSDVKPGCHQDDYNVGVIPLYAPQGTYTLRLIVEYKINALHSDHIIIESQPFDVGPGKVIYLN